MRTICSFALATALLPLLAWGLGLRVNATPSVPCGLFRIEGGVPRHGDFVRVCLPEALSAPYLRSSALCPSDRQPLLKRVAALPGDLIQVTGAGISINGALWPGSAARSRDSRGCPLPSLLESSTVPPGMVLVLGDHPDSYDGRYFGLVPLAFCRKVRQLITF